MVTQQQRKDLPKVEDVDSIFNAEILDGLNKVANIPAVARNHFSEQILTAARNYLGEVQRPTRAEIRGAIAALGKDVRAALDGQRNGVKKAARRLEALPQEVRAILVPQSEIPVTADLLDPENGREALKRLYGLCAAGASVKKSSRQYIDVQYVGPRISGRPADYAEMMLVSELGAAYWEATGKPPERWRSDIDRGPFVALVSHVLDLLGIENDSDPSLVRRYLKELALTKD